MPTTRYEQVLAKYDRAQKHIKDLDAFLRCFRKENSCTIGKKCNAELGTVTYYVDSVPELPVTISQILGDALQNLRSTLDHLVWKLVEAAGNSPSKDTGFPIFDDADGYQSLAPGKIDGLGKFAKKAIDEIYPHKAGNYNLWLLHKLNIIDKHRLLLTVCYRPMGHTMTPSEVQEFLRKRGGKSTSGFNYEIAYTKGPVVPLKAGDELRTIPESEANDGVGFVIDVAVREPGYTEGLPLTLLLNFLSNEVSLILNRLVPFL